MKSRFTGILTLFLAFMIQFSFAQEKTITGTVTSAEDGLPLPGASVVIEGTTRGTQTDLDGKFAMTASQGDKLVFTFIGMKGQTVTIGASNTVDVVLMSDTVIEDVVVIGYGTTTKEAYVGTAAKISSESLQNKTVSNVTQALRGEVAGVNVIMGSGQPGSSATIRIRGFGSVNGNRDPLYVVDGVPYEGSISAINPNDIDSMTILKDATATAVYGSRGANGVVVITTKLGKSGASVIQADFRTSLNMSLLPRYDVIRSPEEYIEVAWNAKYNRGVSQGVSNPAAFANASLFGGGGIQERYNIWDVSSVSQLIDPATGKVRPGVTRRYDPENWEDYAFQTAYRQEANVTMTGGNEKTQYASSFGYVEDEGYIVNSDYKRYSTRLNLVHTPKDWLKAGANIGYSASTSTTNGQSSDSGSIFWFVDNIPSIYPLFIRDEFGNKIEDPYFGGWQYDYGESLTGEGDRSFGGKTNSIADAHYDMDRTFNHEFNGNFFFNVDLYEGLVLEARYGAQYLDRDANSRNNPFYGSMAGQFGSLSKSRIKMTNQNFLQLLRYNKDFGSHGLEVFAAHESTTWDYNIFYATKTNAILYNTFDLDQYTTMVGKPGSYTQKTTLESYFGQASYNYNQKYFLMASVRRDGSSRFRNNKWGTFGSVGASWIISKEDFMADVNFVNYLKLKGSYGVVGDQGNLLMNGYEIYSIGNTDEYSLTLETDQQANPNLTWEESKIAQVGIEATLFDFLDINVDYYRKNTDNLLFSQALPSSTGSVRMWVNDGQLRNSGLEFDVLARVIKPKEAEGFGLSVGINGEFLKNEITEMPIDPGTGLPKVLDGAYAQGYSIYDFYMREWAGVDPSTGVGLWNMYYDDVNSNGVLDAGDVAILSMAHYMSENPDANVQKTTTSVYGDATQKHVGKNSIPKVRGAFRLNMEYKNFDFSTQFSYSIGGYAYDNVYASLMANPTVGGNNWHKDIHSRWQQPGDVTDVPRVSDNLDPNVSSVSTRFLTKADYLALNNVRLGYTFPQRFLEKSGLSTLNIYVSGDNLLFFSKRDGFNPSLSESGNTSTYRYTPLSSISMGVRVQF